MQDLVEETEVVTVRYFPLSQGFQRRGPLTVALGSVGLRCRAGQVSEYRQVLGRWARIVQRR
ncbi:hypothetical protein [Saccharothrix sp. Mg75]|uniref:hypothetical protein n=1 Tax=Saccharothrix sp. Mg75 TaxID=3445357 RepID=UPI003EEE25C6